AHPRDRLASASSFWKRRVLSSWSLAKSLLIAHAVEGRCRARGLLIGLGAGERAVRCCSTDEAEIARAVRILRAVCTRLTERRSGAPTLIRRIGAPTVLDDDGLDGLTDVWVACACHREHRPTKAGGQRAAQKQKRDPHHQPKARRHFKK